MATWNRLNLETLGPGPMLPKDLPGRYPYPFHIGFFVYLTECRLTKIVRPTLDHIYKDRSARKWASLAML